MTLRTFFMAIAMFMAALATTPAFAFKPSITWLQRTDDLLVRADASTVLTVYAALRIDTEAGVDAYSEQRLEFSSSLETLEILEAYTLTPDGRRLNVAPDKIRTLEAHDQGGSEFSDAKVQVVIFPAVAVGAQLHLRHRVTQHTPYFAGHATWHAYYPPGVRFENAKVTIRHEAGVPLKVQARGPAGGQVPAEPGDAPGTVRYAFTFSQTTALPPETGRVAAMDFAPFVHATTFADRAALAAAYQGSARPKAEPNDAIRALARELTAGASTERDKVHRLYQWVSRHIRYVALHVGAGGYVPNPASTILEHRYGDCKDHVVLLEAMLRAIGIESTAALVNSGRAMRLPQLALLAPFNHVITYIPSLDLYLDSTARFAPMGTLPEEVMDKPVLLAASGRVARTPKTHPDTNFSHTRSLIEVSRTGEVKGSSVTLMRGALEVEWRAWQFNNLGRRQEDLARSYLSRFGETGDGEIDAADPLDLEVPWRVKATFELDPVVNVPGPSAMTIPVGLAPGQLRGMATSQPPSARQFEAVCESSRHREETELRLPATVRIERIPPDVSFAQGPLRYSARYRRTGNVVKVVREIVSDRASHTCNARDDQDWVALLRVLQRDLRGQLFIR